jgi:predicted nuclease of restriction endonuclease-like (RecB) superfamily
MNFNQLITQIENTQITLQKYAIKSVNQALVIRNWLIGFYIVEFEQNGEDRAKYGEKLIENLSNELSKKKIKGMSYRSMQQYKQFYLLYKHLFPAIKEKLSIVQPVAAQLQLAINETNKIQQQLAAESSVISKNIDVYETDPMKLLQHLSFRHFAELLPLKDPLKRLFYEQQTIKGNWSARQLKRQIETLLLERIGLSQDKEGLLLSIQKQNDFTEIEETLNDPFVFEFTGLKELPQYTEHELETALLNKIEDFLLELGHGFCFEARQKRITIDNEHDRIDLVFYHRILKCHVLIDLKTVSFKQDFVGQMIYYLNYYKKNIMRKDDNPPVGLILCTSKNEVKVEYATSDIDHKLFVSKYMVELPKIEELKMIIEKNL